MNYRLYLRQVGILFSATALAQLINFAAYPVLSRTYDSAAFGYFSVFVSAASIIGPLACARFDVVVQAAPHSQRFAALKLSTWISIPVAILSGPGYAFLGPPVDGMAPWLIAILFSASVFLIAFTFSGAAFLTKHEAYRPYGLSTVARAACTVVPQIGLFWLLPDARGLVIGFVAGVLAQSIVLAAVVRRLGHRAVPRSRLAMMLRRYRQYPFFDLPSTFLSMFALYAANFFILNLYGASEVGHFAFAFRLAAMPMALLAGSLSEVFFQKAAKSFQLTGGYWLALRFNLAAAGGLAAAIFVATLLLARWFVDIYLGPQWGPVAEVLIIMAPMMAARFVFVAVSAAPLVTGKTGWLLGANAALALTMTAIFLLAKWNGAGFKSYLALSSLSTTIIYLVLVCAIAVTAHRRYREEPPVQSDRSSAGVG